MIDEVNVDSPVLLPSIAAYNIRFLSLSPNQKDQWSRKLSSVKYLASQFTMTALLETHVAGVKAEMFFCRHVEGTKRFYEHGIAVLVQEAWAITYKLLVAMPWEVSGKRNFVFFLRLDAHAESMRRSQLAQATRWANGRVRPGDWTAFAGDRNFVRDDSERQSSSDAEWRPSTRMNAAWGEWLRSIGDAREVPQPEFTWRRIARDQQDSVSWTYEILDVVGANQIAYDSRSLHAFSRRGDDVPFPRVSDHWPVGLRWSDQSTVPRRKKRRAPSVPLVKRTIPQWLMDDTEFVSILDAWFEDWCAHRQRGLEGLQSFVGGMHECASTYLANRIVRAKSGEHRLELAMAAIDALRQDPIHERRLSRVCMADPELEDIVEVHVDLGAPGSAVVPQSVFDRLSERCRAQAQEVIAEISAAPQSAPAVEPGLRGHQQHETTIQALKRMKEGVRKKCCELWDEEHGEFTSDAG